MTNIYTEVHSNGEVYSFRKKEDPIHPRYVWVVLPKKARAVQICDDGALIGSTIETTDELFEKTCNDWVRNHERRQYFNIEDSV